MAEPWMLRVALAYPASLAVPCAGLVVLAMNWPVEVLGDQGLASFSVGLAGVAAWTLTEYVLHRWMLLSVITGFDVVMVTLRDGELPHERRSALLLEREGALHSGVFKAMPFGCGLRPQP